MSQKIYLFNPDNDLALASFSPYYQSPERIRRMMADMSFLPFWFADAGALVKVASEERVEAFLAQYGDWVANRSVGFTCRWEDGEYLPWGWNPSLVHTLRKEGCRVEGLPDDARLERLRKLSSRVHAVDLLAELTTDTRLKGISRVARSLEDVEKMMAQHHRIILKAPWSGSGKGILRTSVPEWNEHAKGWTSRVVRTQGAVMVEPLYDRQTDFAMEYHIDEEGRVAFCGYSLFETDVHGYYKGNVLLSDTAIEQRLSAHLPIDLLHRIREVHMAFISQRLASDYRGYIGIDMMICREGETCFCQPCVEINLRMTMGMVSRILYDRWIAPESEGTFTIEYFKRDGEALERHREWQQRYPLCMDRHRIVEGYTNLSVVDDATTYLLSAFVKRCNQNDSKNY